MCTLDAFYRTDAVTKTYVRVDDRTVSICTLQISKIPNCLTYWDAIPEHNNKTPSGGLDCGLLPLMCSFLIHSMDRFGG